MNSPLKQTGNIRILRIIARLNIGGPAIHTILLTHYLNDTFETKLVVGDVSVGEESMDYLLQKYAVRPVYLNTLKRELSFIGDFKSIISVYGIIRKFKPHIIHTHTAKAGAIGRAAGILYNVLHLNFGRKRIRLIHTFHGHVFSGYFNRFVSAIFVMIERMLALFTDTIIVVSDALKKELSEIYKITADKKIIVIYNGYDLEPFLDIDCKDYHTPKQGQHEYIITTVGRLVPIKGHNFLIQGFSKLNMQSKLVIVGDGILKEQLQNMSNKLGMSGRIEFMGYKKDIIPLYKKTDIFILTSLNEGAPVAVIEAFASARPVIATDVGGVKDLLGNKVTTLSGNINLCERGILIPPSDPEAIATAIDYLFNNPEISDHISNAGREFVKEHFTIERLIREMASLYRDVVTGD